MRRSSRFITLVLVLLFVSPLFAQEEFGTQDGNDLWLPAPAFTPQNATTWRFLTNGFYYADQFGHWEARIPLTEGTLLDHYRVYYNDVSATDSISVSIIQYDFFNNTKTASNTSMFTFTSGGIVGSDDAMVATNLTIDQRPNSTTDRFYTIDVTMPAGMSVLFRGVRLYWKRQVSPAPATATFADVPPNHPFFQFIEALSRSGITSGCAASPPQFCPDAPLTRGQMAVFLSRALGLHWPPL
jgi:S-layer family protein